MKPENPDAKAIFGEALSLNVPAERQVYLDQACAGNQVLRQEVESLLSAYEQAGNFLAQTVPLPSPDFLIECTGTMIGRYKLLEKIGEGGFGVVYMAEQEEPVRRRVALKIIKLGMDTKEVVARFEAERQALAMMDHPNIASVFDGGATETGRPYFVMELVRGVPLTTYCDTHQLSPRERLELFIQVCQAVQHAHQKGVIHRDLKPSNLLVTEQDGRPVPKVIDFGVAKATAAPLTNKTLFTRFHQILGTPAYMSPEQAGLGSVDVDTRSDIYSLGVLLYELLTGRTPFDTQKLMAAGYEAVMRTIREEEPPKPSTRLGTLAEAELSAVAAKRGAEPAKLGRLVRGDLDWIVMKALEKERVRRYETAEGLAADLNRFLVNEPVAARPPSTLYRGQKLVRRHKLAFIAVAAVSFALLLGLGTSTWLFVKEREARRRAVSAEESERELRQKAEVGELAARALLHWSEGNLGEAELLQREALALWRKQLGSNHPQVASALEQLATVLRDSGKLDEAVRTYQEALETKRRGLGTDQRLKELADAEDKGYPGVEQWLNAVLPHAQVRLQSVEFLRESAYSSAQKGHWRDAILKHSRLIDCEPTNALAYHGLAALLAHTDDRANYGRFCAVALERFGPSGDVVVSQGIAKDCLLLALTNIDLAAVMELTDAALEGGTNHWAAGYFWFTKGLAEYRQGRSRESLAWLERVPLQEQIAERNAETFLVSAMAHASLRHTNEAVSALSNGVRLVETRLPRMEEGLLGSKWIDWITAHALMREARATVEFGDLIRK